MDTQNMYEARHKAQNLYIQRQIADLLQAPHLASVEKERQSTPGINVIIPIYSTLRFPLVDVALQSVACQLSPTLGEPFTQGPVNVVVANNGLSDLEAETIREMGERKGLTMHIVDAKPNHPTHKSPAYARNMALQWIKKQRQVDETLNLDAIVLLDDDSALLPGSLSTLYRAFKETPDTVAVTAEVSPTTELTQDAYLRRNSRQIPADAPQRRLPKLLNARGFDIGGMVAYSSQIAGKTNGLLMSADIVLDRFPGFFPLLKSGEDMSFSAALSRHGTIISEARATVLDLAREDEGQMFQQQFQWGKDHQMLLHHLEQLGLVEPGIHILTPVGESHWEESILPNTEHTTGFIINPDEINKVVQELERRVNEGYFPQYAEQLRGAFPFVRNILDLIRQTEPQRSLIRDDLPHPLRRSTNSPRQLPISKLGRLAGNILGILEIAELVEENTVDIPSRFVLGLRQAGTWD